MASVRSSACAAPAQLLPSRMPVKSDYHLAPLLTGLHATRPVLPLTLPVLHAPASLPAAVSNTRTFPYVASLHYKPTTGNTPYLGCSGTVIHPRMVLTAGAWQAMGRVLSAAHAEAWPDWTPAAQERALDHRGRADSRAASLRLQPAA